MLALHCIFYSRVAHQSQSEHPNGESHLTTSRFMDDRRMRRIPTYTAYLNLFLITTALLKIGEWDMVTKYSQFSDIPARHQCRLATVASRPSNANRTTTGLCFWSCQIAGSNYTGDIFFRGLFFRIVRHCKSWMDIVVENEVMATAAPWLEPGWQSLNIARQIREAQQQLIVCDKSETSPREARSTSNLERCSLYILHAHV